MYTSTQYLKTIPTYVFQSISKSPRSYKYHGFLTCMCVCSQVSVSIPQHFWLHKVHRLILRIICGQLICKNVWYTQPVLVLFTILHFVTFCFIYLT